MYPVSTEVVAVSEIIRVGPNLIYRVPSRGNQSLKTGKGQASTNRRKMIKWVYSTFRIPALRRMRQGDCSSNSSLKKKERKKITTQRSLVTGKVLSKSQHA